MGVLKALGGLLLLAAVGLGGYFLVQRLLPYADQPITDVKLEGHLTYVSNQAILDRIAPFRQASFFNVDLAGIRNELESMSWIDWRISRLSSRPASLISIAAPGRKTVCVSARRIRACRSAAA